jgi:hypothetical protein
MHTGSLTRVLGMMLVPLAALAATNEIYEMRKIEYNQ